MQNHQLIKNPVKNCSEQKAIYKEQSQNHCRDDSLTLNEVQKIMRQFVDQREWHSFHTPRNLVLALVGEVGQVSQIFQWKGEVKTNLPQFSQKQKIHVGQQLADVLSYLIRLSDVCGIDLSKSFQDKIQKSRNKYPKDLVKGSSKKYSEYKQYAKQKIQAQQNSEVNN